MAGSHEAGETILVYKGLRPIDLFGVRPAEVGNFKAGSGDCITADELELLSKLGADALPKLQLRWLGDKMFVGTGAMTGGPYEMSLSPPDDVYYPRLAENQLQMAQGNLVHHPI